VLHDSGEAGALASRAAVVVDGVLGTGTSADPSLRGDARDIVKAVMAATDGATVVAVDIPSGIDPDDGSAPDPVVLAADVTVTFGGYKAGLLIAPGSILAGRVRLIDIGIADDLERLEPLLVVP
jgi:NAD(P)H-hydrate repair Nnr-like enzyme with NAD(P)H-hydrate epimerase domain